jgi:hypothetical protein
VRVRVTMMMKGWRAQKILKAGPNNRLPAFIQTCEDPNDGRNRCAQVSCVFQADAPNQEFNGVVRVFNFQGTARKIRRSQ